MSTKPAKSKITKQKKWFKSLARLKTPKSWEKSKSWEKASKNQKNVWTAELIEQYQDC